MADELVSVAEDSARGSFFLVSGTAASTVILAISTILVGRLLGSELYGMYTLALVIPNLLLLFTDLGIDQGIIKFTASLRLKGEAQRAAKIIKHGLLFKAIAGVLVFLVSYALADILASFLLQRPDMTFYIRIISTSILFQAIFATQTLAFVGLDKAEYTALAVNIQAFAKAIISIMLVLLGFGVLGATVGFVSGYVIAAVSTTAILFLLMREKQDPIDDFHIGESLKTLMHYGTPLYLSALLTGFTPFYQSIMLSIFTTYGDIGNYNAAGNFSAIMAIISGPITTALLPAFSKIDSSTKRRIKVFFKLANKYTVLIVVPIATLMIVFSTEIVQIVYGSTFQSASLFLAMYYFLYFLVGLGYLALNSFYNGIGETGTTLKINIIIFVTIAILSPFLTKAYGVPGLIIAFLVANGAGTIYGSYTARKKFQIEFATRSIIKTYLISAASIGPTLLLSLIHTSRLVTLIAGAAIFLFMYITLIPLARIVSAPELQRIFHIVQKIRVVAFIAKPILKYQQKILGTNGKLTDDDETRIY
jgi:O-antigen/teichoic acid export membrane protein